MAKLRDRLIHGTLRLLRKAVGSATFGGILIAAVPILVQQAVAHLGGVGVHLEPALVGRITAAITDWLAAFLTVGGGVALMGIRDAAKGYPSEEA